MATQPVSGNQSYTEVRNLSPQLPQLDVANIVYNDFVI